MTTPRWQRIEDLFQRAVELAPGERSAMLDEACAGDPSLRGEIESLLAYDFEEGPTFAGPARPASRANAKSLSKGDKLGPYEISGLIGAGGMGEVYRARDPRLQRDVAIKVLSAEVALDPLRRQRFEREARAVAALNHPNIVSIYDVGEDRGITSSLPNWSKVNRCVRANLACGRRWISLPRSLPGSAPRTRLASCIATSRPPISCSLATAR